MDLMHNFFFQEKHLRNFSSAHSNAKAKHSANSYTIIWLQRLYVYEVQQNDL